MLRVGGLRHERDGGVLRAPGEVRRIPAADGRRLKPGEAERDVGANARAKHCIRHTAGVDQHVGEGGQ